MLPFINRWGICNLILIWGCSTALSLGQSKDELGTEIYKKVAGSVFLVQVEDQNGRTVGTGSAFLVEGGFLVTNAHVAKAGNIFLKTDLLKLPCSIEKVDETNDLAILRIPGSIQANPLTLSSSPLKSGSSVFAIGNPQGLERTITQGLYTGIRKTDNLELMQLSAALSPGSSGGPVVNTDGEVVGIAVGVLSSGQNLNFAVPVQALKDLLEGEKNLPLAQIDSVYENLRGLRNEQLELEYSDLEGSPYHEKQREINSKERELVNLAQSESAEKVAQLARSEVDAWSVGELNVELSRLAISKTKKPSPDLYFTLAKALYRQASFQGGEKGAKFYSEGEASALKALSYDPSPSFERYELLADIQSSIAGKESLAHQNYLKALNKAKETSSSSSTEWIYHGLFATAMAMDKKEDAQKWFAEHIAKLQLSSYMWGLYAGEFERATEYRLAAFAFDQQATKQSGNSAYSSWVSSAVNYWRANQQDEALRTARLAIEKGAGVKGSELRLSSAHYILANILFDRGVFDQALSHARQSVTLDPNDPWEYYILARTLNALGRSDEAISAAKSAIRLSDGEYGSMHFELGYAYSKQENCEMAILSYEKAAELNPSDTASPFNIALCYIKMNYRLDAIKWFEEVLKRDPNHPDKETILERLRLLRR
jgi:tetratricopeptide (TPR) repeat protein